MRPASRRGRRARPTILCDLETEGRRFRHHLGEFYCATLDAPVLFEIKREDVVYARVYDIRGRAIPSLLNVRGPDAGPED